MWSSVPKPSFSKDTILEHFYHRKRLDTISSRIDNSPPKKQAHILNDLKGKILQLSKKSEIEAENRLLVDKIIKVSSRENSSKRTVKNYSPIRVKKSKDTKISLENLRLSHKIKSCKPHYSFEKLRKQFRFSDKNCSNLGLSFKGLSPSSLVQTKIC